MSDMEQKKVTFKVAKALKEAGYPQEDCDEYFNKYGAIDAYLGYNIARPTYLEVWLWLWRSRGFYIDIAHYYNSDEVTIWDNNYNKIKSIECMEKYRDPEEVIAKAIEHLVDKDLIR